MHMRIERGKQLMVKRGGARPAKALAALAAAGALIAGGVAVSGCGAAATLDPIARAAEVTSHQSGAKIALTMQLSSPMLPGGLAITAEGYINERRHAGELVMDLSRIPGISMLPGGAGNGQVRMIFLYPTIYMNMPFLAGKLPEGKTWMKLDISKAAQAAGIDTSQFSSIDQTDPTKFLDYLRASSGAVITLGSERVNGVTVTHYRANLELSRILDRLPGEQKAAAKAALEKLGESGSIPVDVWVDAQGRVRRIQLSFGGLGAGAGGTGTASGVAGAAAVSGAITIDFKSYGPVPPIVSPPAGQVFDASALAAAKIKSGQSGQGGF